MTEILAIKSDFERFDEWIEAFSEWDIKVINWQDIKNHDSIDYALVWKPEAGALKRLKGLKVIFSIGAGLDHLKGENILPEGLPVVKMVDPCLTRGMVEYVLYYILRQHRFMGEYEQQQRNHRWHGILQIPANQRTVGILGMGELGNACAQALLALDFRVTGWSRTPKQLASIDHYHSEEQLPDMLSRCDFLVCLLPHTKQTHGILNVQNFQHLPHGAVLINAGRGGLQLEQDIVAALDSGQLSAAVLDVFEKEPLANHSPLWDHPKVSITPHVASMTLPATSAQHVYRNIERFRAGLPLTHVADLQRGY